MSGSCSCCAWHRWGKKKSFVLKQVDKKLSNMRQAQHCHDSWHCPIWCVMGNEQRLFGTVGLLCIAACCCNPSRPRPGEGSRSTTGITLFGRRTSWMKMFRVGGRNAARRYVEEATPGPNQRDLDNCEDMSTRSVGCSSVFEVWCYVVFASRTVR